MSTEWRQRIKVRKEEGSVREGGKEGRRRKKEREREEGRKKEILNKDHRA